MFCNMCFVVTVYTSIPKPTMRANAEKIYISSE